MSGYASPEIAASSAPGEAVFLEKPFTPRALLASVRQVMAVIPSGGGAEEPN